MLLPLREESGVDEDEDEDEDEEEGDEDDAASPPSLSPSGSPVEGGGGRLKTRSAGSFCAAVLSAFARNVERLSAGRSRSVRAVG